MNPSYVPHTTFTNWSDIGPSGEPSGEDLFSCRGDRRDSSAAEDATAAAATFDAAGDDGSPRDDESDDNDNEEHGVENEPFSQPSGPWTNLDDMVESWEAVANCCNHRFKLCYTTASHVCVKYSKKVDSAAADVTCRIPDFGYFYCSCTKQGPSATKPHAKSWCPFKVYSFAMSSLFDFTVMLHSDTLQT